MNLFRNQHNTRHGNKNSTTRNTFHSNICDRRHSTLHSNNSDHRHSTLHSNNSDHRHSTLHSNNSDHRHSTLHGNNSDLQRNRNHKRKNQSIFPREALAFPNPFDTAALWIVQHADSKHGKPGGRFLRKNETLSQELIELGTGKKNCVEEYYVQKISRFLMVSFFCLAVLTVVLVSDHRQDRRIADGVLDRPGYGEGGADQSLLLRVGAEESEAFDVHLDARSYTSSQVKTLLKDAASTLDTMLPGKNASMDEVRSALCLPATLEDGAVSVEYYITPGGMIDDDGSICGQPDPKGTLVTINATLTCQKKTSTYECAARIYPPVLTAREQFRENVRSAVDKARQADPTATQVKLPSTVDGKKLYWSYPKDSSLTLIMILMLVIPIAFWAREDSKVHDAAKARQAQLELDYSQVLWKLTMLLSAGLTIRGAFSRITDQYEAEIAEKYGTQSARRPRPRPERQRSAEKQPCTGKQTYTEKQTCAGKQAYTEKQTCTGKQANTRMQTSIRKTEGGKRYVYEEMLLTIREMSSGVPEASAYENFGRRCGLPMYIKLGSLLSQNLKKGSKGLTTLLEHEAVLSMDQHKMAVRKLGERASVKMLLPMVLMFGVVLIILMVPAFLSM